MKLDGKSQNNKSFTFFFNIMVSFLSGYMKCTVMMKIGTEEKEIIKKKNITLIRLSQLLHDMYMMSAFLKKDGNYQNADTERQKIESIFSDMFFIMNTQNKMRESLQIKE